METAEPSTEFAVISARSERQAMDWSLVLASQDIPTSIERLPENRWGLVVAASDHGRAVESIHQYRLENRFWRWEQPLPWSETPFHWGSVVWCFFVVFAFQIQKLALPALEQAARFDSLAAQNGDWWRFFTAMHLHADLAHLAANATTGFVLLGLAMAGYGSGCALLAAYLAGAAGNLAGLLVYQSPYFGLGASGMVMGALGLISALSLQQWRTGHAAPRHLVKSSLAGILLFVILGTNPASDVIAHMGGFLAGLLLGGILVCLPRPAIESRKFQMSNWTILAVLFLWTTWSALSRI